MTNNMEKRSTVANKEGRKGGSPVAAQKLELELDDAGKVLAFRGFFKPRFVVSTQMRDGDNGKPRP